MLSDALDVIDRLPPSTATGRREQQIDKVINRGTLLTVFAGSSFWQIFPNRGLVSENWSDLSLWHKITDYAWHMTLPLIAMSFSAFATLTILTKNCFLEEINKQYMEIFWTKP